MNEPTAPTLRPKRATNGFAALRRHYDAESQNCPVRATRSTSATTTFLIPRRGDEARTGSDAAEAGGCIVNISSTYTGVGAGGASGYVASRYVVEGLRKSAVLEVARSDV
jgi:NAD(P)-dependent dehydrogenase (short-subunit alcohol dehydrogenase family)